MGRRCWIRASFSNIWRRGLPQSPRSCRRHCEAFRATGLALTVCEKAVQFHYERALRSPEQRSETWVARVVGQLTKGLEALDREAPASGWIGEAGIGAADITVACAFGFIAGDVGGPRRSRALSQARRLRRARGRVAGVPRRAADRRRYRAGRLTIQGAGSTRAVNSREAPRHDRIAVHDARRRRSEARRPRGADPGGSPSPRAARGRNPDPGRRRRGEPARHLAATGVLCAAAGRDRHSRPRDRGRGGRARPRRHAA